jgi:hypothetical protein
VEVGTVENFAPSYACSRSARSGAFLGACSTGVTGTWTAYGLGLGHSGVVLAPVSTQVQGTAVSIAALRDKATAQAMARTTALLPISDVVVFDGFAGIRSWSPPV